jgi:hypothetical protein
MYPKGKETMSTGQQHESKTPDLSFESIDDQINDYVNDFIDEFESLDLGGEGAVATPQTPADRAQRLMTTYAGVRPILLALASVPLVPRPGAPPSRSSWPRWTA